MAHSSLPLPIWRHKELSMWNCSAHYVFFRDSQEIIAQLKKCNCHVHLTVLSFLIRSLIIFASWVRKACCMVSKQHTLCEHSQKRHSGVSCAVGLQSCCRNTSNTHGRPA